MDEAGNLYFVDRTVDTIKHKGYRVSASEIEAVLQEHPAVVGACVVGVPDEKVGERIKGTQGNRTPAGAAEISWTKKNRIGTCSQIIINAE